jgi:hypothetical protein
MQALLKNNIKSCFKLTNYRTFTNSNPMKDKETAEEKMYFDKEESN